MDKLALSEAANIRNDNDFGEIRKSVAHKLFEDPSYKALDAMYDMSCATEDFVNSIATQYPEATMWVGGSLGRREMLPNSDIDLFVIYDSNDYQKIGINIDGVDKFELGHIDTARLDDLLNYSLVDANRFIDGRMVGNTPATHVEKMIVEASTVDRQLANNISEYFYYRYFDFPNKTTPMGPNLKYSSGSSRDTIFFNMISRMGSGVFPASRGKQPELAQALQYTENHFDIRPPYAAIDLMFIVKNAAISVYDATGDPRNRYVSSASLESIYDFCRDKFRAQGINDASEFVRIYGAARQEIELAVDTLFTRALSEHPAAAELAELLALPKKDLPRACINSVTSNSKYPHSLTSFAAWLTIMSGPSGRDMNLIAESLVDGPLDKVWGGIMAVVCSSATEDYTLRNLAYWLSDNEKGAYLTKLITRNPSASSATKALASGYYKVKEIIT